MAELRNFTPFPNLQFANWDTQGREFGVFMVKVAWDIAPDGSCALSEEQEPFHFADQFVGEPNESPPVYASDLVPYKPQTDIILNATAFAPGGAAAAFWDVAVKVFAGAGDAPLVDKRLTVTGPRRWEPGWTGWKLTKPEPVQSVDLRYDKAFGGMIQTGEDSDGAPILKASEHNPVGCGWLDKELSPTDAPLAAPQIMDPSEAVPAPHTVLKSVGLGPVQAAWLPRRPKGGTYDAHWEDNVWPGYPADYDFAFHNAASDGMVFDLPLGDGVTVRLTHMHPTIPDWTISVPYPDLVAYLGMGQRTVPTLMMLDTVHLDIAENQLSDPRAFTVLRVVFDRAAVDSITLGGRSPRLDPRDMARPPHPHDVARFLPEEDAEVPQEDEMEQVS